MTTQRKILLIGSLPEEVREILAESLENNQALVVRPNLAEALPDIASNGDYSLVLTKPDSLRRGGEHLSSLNNGHEDSAARSLLTNVEFPELVGQCEKFRDVCRRIGQVASTDSTVLIDGESGTGKELVARAIHVHSQRPHKPFIKVNCAALAETLIESELFGHIRGAFTGAVRDRKGRFAEAKGGTILLDEVGSMPLGSQAKFLRVLQEKEFEPVGSSKTTKVDVRVIATNNFDLAKAVEEGTFREDLYYRVSVFPIIVPPLRQRTEDLPVLVEHFLRKYRHLNPHVSRISSEALKTLTDYQWPGNVRQLENAVQHGLIIETTNDLRASSLPITLNGSSGAAKPMGEDSELQTLREKLRMYEKQLIQEALAKSMGKKKTAAELLGVHPKNLNSLLNKHHL
jgi:transcriptional regulator with PAS, ATPase and Fis domain